MTDDQNESDLTERCSHLHEIGALRSRSAAAAREMEDLYEQVIRQGAVLDRQIQRERVVTAERDALRAVADRVREAIHAAELADSAIGLKVAIGLILNWLAPIDEVTIKRGQEIASSPTPKSA